MPRVELEDVRSKATGRWPEIINQVAGIPDDYLTTKHNPCPRCGGSNRWRAFNDFSQTGGCLCSRCGKFADGFAVVSWYCGVSFSASLDRVAQYLGVTPSKNGHSRRIPARGKNPAPRRATNGHARRSAPTPDKSEDLEPIAWDDMQVRVWCLRKKPITPEGIQAAGGYLARYRNHLKVIVIPVIGESGQPVNWIIYNLAGGKLPAGTKENREWIKVKNLNKNPGLAGLEIK